MKNQSKYPFLLSIFLLLLTWFATGCEEEVDINLPAGEAKIVVQGHIQQGEAPFVVLTRSVPVLAPVSPEVLLGSFVRGAQVSVTVDGQSYPLQEVPLNQLSVEQIRLLAELYSLPAAPPSGEEAPAMPFFLYTSSEFKGEAGKLYRLHVAHEGQNLTALTSIPQLNPPDSLWFRPHPDPARDSLFTLYYRYQDPDTLGNSVRYMTKRNREPFYPPLFSSLFNDEFANGRAAIDFPLERGYPRTATPDIEYGRYFRRGDTVTVRWSAIDLPHYQFWLTLEYSQNSNGNPFSTPIQVRSNVQGGLGVWGGYGTTYHRVVAPR